jgi:hypothetical protein
VIADTVSADVVSYRVTDRIWEHSWDNVRSWFWYNVGYRVRGGIDEHVQHAIQSHVQQTVWDDLRDNTQLEVDKLYMLADRVVGKLASPGRKRALTRVGFIAMQNIRLQVRDNAMDQAREQVWDQVWGQVRDNLGGRVWNRVWDTTGDRVEVQARQWVGNWVDDQTAREVNRRERDS